MEPVRHREREPRVVDVDVELVELDVLGEILSDGGKQCLVRRGVVEGLPSVAIIEIPRSGTKSAVGPFAPLSFRATRFPSSAHSSGVVRISVTVGLCTYRFRERNCSGTVSIGPKFTMSSAPSETTCGTPSSPATSSRFGWAASTPPTSSSQSSVV